MTDTLKGRQDLSPGEIWESEYMGEAYDLVLANSEIYQEVVGKHRNFLQGADRLLEVGAGTGNLTEKLLEDGHAVVATDMSEKPLEVLRSKCKGCNDRLSVLRSDAIALPFADGSFDGSSSMFMAHFVSDMETLLKEQNRVLIEKNGIFVITWRSTNDNIDQVIESYRGSLEKKGLLNDPEYVRAMSVMEQGLRDGVANGLENQYSVDDMNRLLKQAGFGNIQELDNPYFGQCHTLTCKK